MSFDQANDPDILGGKLNPKPSTFAYFTGLLYLIAGGFFFLFVTYASAAWSRWKDRNNKLALRRRHGIPDSDQRAFNVAYAAAQLAQKKGAREGRNTPADNADAAVPQDAVLSQHLTPNGSANGSSLRHRATSSIPHIPGHLPPSWAPVQNQHQPSPFRELSVPQQARDHSVPRINIVQATPHNSSTPSFSDSGHRSSFPGKANTPYSASSSRLPSPQKSPHKTLFPPSSVHQRLKRSLEYDDIPEEGDEEGFKKTRVEGEQLIDGDEDAEWDERSRASRRHVVAPYQGKRGAKRIYDDDDDAQYDEYEKRDKRARKVSGPRAEVEDMDVDEAHIRDDEMDEDADTSPMYAVRSRGRKRDRAEAGSTFGGDEEHDTDESMENAASHTKSRKRERKRHHHIGEDEEEADFPSAPPSRSGRGHRRQGRKSRTVSRDEEDTLMSDTPEDDEDADSAVLSTSTSGRRRKAGEEWEVHGVRYKMARNGEKLRQALIRSERSRFSMPSDSVHPDTRANLNVFVETWLTEEEYELAKERQALAWQDGSVGSLNEDKDRGDVETPGSLKRPGKDLLWASQRSPTKSSKKSPMAMSMYQVGIRPSYNFPKSVQQHRINGSEQADKGKGKDKENDDDFLGKKSPAMTRSVSGSSSSSKDALTVSTLARSTSGSMGSPTKRMTGSGTRSPRPSLSSSHHGNSFSKWEKQDLEAESMRRIRESKEKTQPTASTSAPATPTVAPVATPVSFSAPTSTAASPVASTSAPQPAFKLPSATATAPKPFVVGLGGSSPSTSPTASSGAAGPPKMPNFFPSANGGAAGSTKPVNPSPLGAAPPLVAATSTPTPTPSAPTPAAPTPAPAFKLPAQPAANGAPGPTILFGAPTPTPAASGGAEPPKQNGFSFGGGAGAFAFGKPQAGSGAAPAASAPAPPAPKVESAFGAGSAFGSAPTPVPQSQQQQPAASGSASGNGGSQGANAAGAGAQPKFNFGAVAPTPAQSGVPSPAPTPAPAASNAAPAKPAFNFGSGGSNAFGAPSATNGAAPSPFGASTQSQNPAASAPAAAPTPAAFGFGAPKQETKAPSSAFAFGNNMAQGTNGSSSSLAGAVGQGAGAANGAFGTFGKPAPSTSPAPQNVFGSSSTPSPVFGGPTTPANKPSAAAVFGAPSIASSLSQDASSTTPKGSPAQFAFGAPSTTPAGTPTNGAPPATPFKFNFGGGASAPTPATPAKFTFGSGGGDAKPATSTAFSFGQK